MTVMDLQDVRTVFHPDWRGHLLEAGHMPTLQDWLRANALDPQDVDIAPILIEQRDDKPVVHYTAALRDAAGHRYRDPVAGGAAREERTVPR